MDMLPTPPGVIRRRRQQVALIGVGVTAVSLMFLCEILIIAGNGGLRSAPTCKRQPQDTEPSEPMCAIFCDGRSTAQRGRRTTMSCSMRALLIPR